YDRVCRIAMGYQDAADETAIVELRAPKVPEGWRGKSVELVRRTREHPDIRIGSSVRGAIDMTKLASALAARRGRSVTDYGVGRDAALVSLSGRIRLREAGTRDAEVVITELYHSVFGRQDKHDGDDDASGGA